MEHQLIKSFPDDLLLALFSEHCQQPLIQVNVKPTFLEPEFSHSKLLEDHYRGDYATPRNGFARFSPILKDWRVIRVIPTAPDFGFVAVLYVNERRRQMVLAQSGLGLGATENASRHTPNGLSEESAFWALVQAVLSGSTAALEALALPHWRQVLDAARERDFSLTLTGHGMGGWLAEVGLWRLARETMERGEALSSVKLVTFDSPGAHPLGTPSTKQASQKPDTQVENAEANIKAQDSRTEELVESVDCIKYLTLPNYVNTLSKQYAPRVYTIRHERFQTLSWPPNVGFLQVLFSLHSVTGLIEVLAERNNESILESEEGRQSTFAGSFDAVTDWPSMTRYGPHYMDRLLADVSQWRSFDALLSRRDAPLDCNSWEKSDAVYRVSFHQTRGHTLRVLPSDTSAPLSFTRFVRPSAYEFPLITSLPKPAHSIGTQSEVSAIVSQRSSVSNATEPQPAPNSSARCSNLMRLALIDLKSLHDAMAMDTSTPPGLRSSLLDLKHQVRAHIFGDQMSVRMTSKETPLETLEDRLVDLLTLYPHLKRAVDSAAPHPKIEKDTQSGGAQSPPPAASPPESPKNSVQTTPQEKKSSSCNIL